MTLRKLLPLAALFAIVLPAGQASAAPKSKFRFTQATYVATEGQGSIDVTITRQARHGHSRINQTSSVNFSITGGSATEGVDYTLATGTLTFASGDTTKTATVQIAQDTDIEGLETIGLKLSAATNNALITNPRTAQVLIADDDGPTQVQLVPASQNVNESIGNASFFAVRSGDITGTTGVDYATSDGTATQPDDYTSTSGSVSFGVAEFSKTINVPVVDDSTPEDSESFSASLSNLTGAGTFPNAASSVTASATIIDNDAAPVFTLDASSYSVNEDGSVDVTVQRHTSSTAAAVSANDVFLVDWSTADGTAKNPADYLPGADQELEFDSTDDAETITISATAAATQIGLVDDTLAEGDETFTLSLTSASIAPGGSGVAPSLGSPSSATVTIKDDEAPAGGNTGGSGTGGNGPITNTPTGDTTGAGGQTGGGQVVLGARQSACGLKVSASKKQKLLKQKVLKLKLRAGQRCKVSLTTVIKQLKAKKPARSAKALRFKGKKASVTLQPGKATTVKVKFTKKTLKALKKALQARKKFVATVVVTERDAASKVKKRTLRITIRR